MERAANSSDLRMQPPFIAQNSSFCRNLTDNASSGGFAETRCGDDGILRSLDEDSNPILIAIIITALYSIVCMVGLVGNVLVMYIIVSKTPQTSTNFYLTNRENQKASRPIRKINPGRTEGIRAP